MVSVEWFGIFQIVPICSFAYLQWDVLLENAPQSLDFAVAEKGIYSDCHGMQMSSSYVNKVTTSLRYPLTINSLGMFSTKRSMYSM